MKTYSNIPLPDAPRRWKEGEFGIYINHKDNGYLPTDDPNTDMSSRRYEAEFTIVKELSAQSAIHAFTRMTSDSALEQQVIDTIEVNGGNALDVVKDYPTKVSSAIFPALPTGGALKRGQIYSYNNGAVMVVQDHNRTIYAPELTPALFSFYRENPEGKEWIPGERVALNATRTYKGKTYKCIQAHQTQADWTPDATPSLWVEIEEPSPEIPVWVQPTGAHDAYRLGAKVHFPKITDPVYESLIDYNVYSPLTYPAGWKKL